MIAAFYDCGKRKDLVTENGMIPGSQKVGSKAVAFYGRRNALHLWAYFGFRKMCLSRVVKNVGLSAILLAGLPAVLLEGLTPCPYLRGVIPHFPIFVWNVV